ncbi:hypothetical protein [uncultured Winogradskyella sp.]|uniref:hypothetical protein n=1 Tax=uncultured Winogradskyella sp. TaxID=395353 RepID=UPI0030D96773|tara:strand:+ start:351 stop:593 length:243 start_codon:yes stop_codon:yes gene_type:complete
MNKLTIAIIFLILCTSCRQEKLNETARIDKTELDKRLTKKLEQAYKTDSIKGFSVAIVDENGLVYKNGFGFSDLDTTKIY